jgi:hypothetical protein
MPEIGLPVSGLLFAFAGDQRDINEHDEHTEHANEEKEDKHDINPPFT